MTISIVYEAVNGRTGEVLIRNSNLKKIKKLVDSFNKHVNCEEIVIFKHIITDDVVECVGR